MGWSIYVNWPGAEEAQQGQHPGFLNDDHGWAGWVMAVLADAEAMRIMQSLELTALLTGAAGDDLVWPDDVVEAATNLRVLVVSNDPAVEPLVRVYAAANPSAEDSADALVQDLSDVEKIARYAESLGADEMTLEYTR